MELNNNKQKPRLFVDMDGTLTEWRNIVVGVEEYEDIPDVLTKINNLLTTPGYFYSLRPHLSVVNAIRRIIKHDELEVYILSCCLADNEAGSPKEEKNKWLNKFIPEIDAAHRLFVPDGEDKRNYVPNGVTKSDYLLDDYTKNLELWECSGTGIKLLNDVNSSKGTWKGNKIRFDRPGEEIEKAIINIILHNENIRDKEPQKESSPFDYRDFDFTSEPIEK